MQTIRTKSLAKSKRGHGCKRGSIKASNGFKNPLSTSTIINGYLPFKSNRSRSNRKWSKKKKKDYKKAHIWNKIGGDYSLCSNFSNYPLPQSSCGSVNHSFLNTSNQIDASIATTYLTNMKPGRSFSQKRIPEKQIKRMMNSLEVSKASSQAKLKVNPEVARKSNTLLEKGKEFLNLKNYDDALKFLTKALKVNEHNYDAMFFKGVTYLDSGNPSKAIKELTMIIENVPNFKNTVYLVLSTCYMRNNDTVSALMILNKAIQKYPKFVEAYVARGQVYTLLNINDNNNLSLGQIYERIITDYQSVINLLPNKGLGYIGKGDALKGLGDYSAALK